MRLIAASILALAIAVAVVGWRATRSHSDGGCSAVVTYGDRAVCP